MGTSGWHYPHWRDRFYPEGLATDRWLAYYAARFDCVELNNSFYRLPTPETIRSWVRATPEAFLFAVKASRLITHMKKLRDCEQHLAVFLETIGHFGAKLGPILFQLPPRWHVNTARLEAFLGLLPPHQGYAFEFRDPSWHTDEVYRILAEHRVAFCVFELGGLHSPEVLTTDRVYVRLHGPAGAYAGRYGPRGLGAWARALVAWQAQDRDVFLFFDNDERGYAVQNARSLLRLCDGLATARG